ncbi:DMT family transporter [Dehalobacterium formicoaceticum]|uniref:DMT family transporter n=1 Tax=Dehalobacterium formicoaceticum TaxID=51515 RepID=A0ABT1Y364_9FIRM|nr:DMT family transporter [Dehalobacterium formicoaceticum]MCR6545314.1 DMT family transporter [Dehalobacterium formicoaceticum]
MEIMLPLLIAALSGVAMALQGTVNSFMSKTIGQMETTFIVHLIGVVTAALVLFVFHLGRGQLSRLGEVPWYGYLGGIISVLIIYGVVASMTKVGVANATTAIIVGQVTAALVIDCTGFLGMEKFPFTWLKGFGILLLAFGARLMLSK